jgi:hypothetical protein
MGWLHVSEQQPHALLRSNPCRRSIFPALRSILSCAVKVPPCRFANEGRSTEDEAAMLKMMEVDEAAMLKMMEVADVINLTRILAFRIKMKKAYAQIKVE